MRIGYWSSDVCSSDLDHRVGVDGGRGDIAIRPDDAGEGLDVGPRQALQLGLGKVARVDLNGALAAAVGQVHDRALEGHPERQRLHLVHTGARMVADADLGRPPRVVVAAGPGPEGVPRETGTGTWRERGG